MKNLLLLICALTINLLTQAQDKVFTIVAVQGQAVCNGKQLGVGQQINANNSVSIGDRSYLGLLHKSGKPVELKTAGAYELKPYHDKLANGKNFQEKYMNYVVSNLTEKGSDGKYQKNMAITGSVERAMNNNEIIIPLPSKCILLGKSLKLEWMSKPIQKAEYQVVVRNMKEEIVFTQSTADNAIQLDLSTVDFDKDQYYLVSVKDLNNKTKSNTVNLFIPNETEKNLLISDLQSAKEELDLSSSIGQLAFAKVCEQKGLFLEAMEAYKRAKDLSPDVEFYATNYQQFLDEIAAAN